jgi:hypothetical protein
MRVVCHDITESPARRAAAQPEERHLAEQGTRLIVLRAEISTLLNPAQRLPPPGASSISLMNAHCGKSRHYPACSLIQMGVEECQLILEFTIDLRQKLVAIGLGAAHGDFHSTGIIKIRISSDAIIRGVHCLVSTQGYLIIVFNFHSLSMNTLSRQQSRPSMLHACAD